MKTTILPPLQQLMLENTLVVLKLNPEDEQLLRLTANALFLAGERKGMKDMVKSNKAALDKVFKK